METTPTRVTETKALDQEYRGKRHATKLLRAEEDALTWATHKERLAEIQQRYSYDTYIVNLRTTQYEERDAAKAEAEAEAEAVAVEL